MIAVKLVQTLRSIGALDVAIRAALAILIGLLIIASTQLEPARAFAIAGASFACSLVLEIAWRIVRPATWRG